MLEYNAYQLLIRELSDKLVSAQKPIRILDLIKWDPAIEKQFFHHQCKKLPAVTAKYYEKHNPFSFNPLHKIEEFEFIEQLIRKKLGVYSGVGNIMQRMCREYKKVIKMLMARGSKKFSKLAQELYGSASDTFHIGAPNLKDLALLLTDTLFNIKNQIKTKLDEKKFSAEETVALLSARLANYFQEENYQPRVVLSDGIVADASAGAEKIKIHAGNIYSEREIKVFEIHEGWVHLGTTLNGLQQPICSFLSKGPPSSTVTQEGLAIFTEVITFSSSPDRVKRITNRISAVSMAEEGADFLDVFHFYCDKGLTKAESYQLTSRVFRGSLPNAGPFTKDLVYSKGFILIYNYIRLAVQKGLVHQIPLLFLGKTNLEDLHILAELIDEKIIIPPKYLPPQFKDLAALSAWMCYSLFLNKLDLKQLALDFELLLQKQKNK